MRTADIILDIPAQSFDAAFTYSIPEQLTELFVGCCVVVPLGHRRALGFVVSIDDHPATPEQWSDLVAYSRAQSKPFAAERTAVSDARFPNATLLDNRHANEQAVQQDLFADLLQAEDEPPIMEQTFVSRAQQDKLTASSASLSSSHGATPASAEELKELLEYFTNRQIIPHKLKSVISVETKSFFGSDQVRLARWMSQEYVAPLSSCIRLFVPAGALPKLVYQAGSWQLERPQTTPREDTWVRLLPAAQGFRPRKGAVKQQAILSALQEGALRTAELSYEYGAVSAALRSLEKHQVVEVFKKRSMRGDVSLFQSTAALHSLPTLTDEQQGAVDAIIQAQTRGQGEVLVVDGVTGSGKTEVYLRAIEHCLSQGKSACVLVPEIALTPQTVARFRGRFGDTVALLHSKMSKGERLDQFDAIAQGEARVVIGARSALFAPLNHVGLIVIDEEHETSYKQDQSPRYDARRVAEYMMQDCGGVLVLGSATPRIESLYELDHNPRWSHLRLPNRVNASPLPPIEVVDMANEFSRGGRSMFSRPLQAALLDMAHRGHKAVLLLNQRGFAQFLLCRDCGFVPRCPQCETSLTYHEEAGRLMCHHCGHQIAIPARCPKCTSPYLKRFGAGTQRLQAELEAFFAQHELTIPIVRMDADTTSTKGAHARLLDSFAGYDSAVLLGTQMVAKGLDFPDVVLVGVINADTQLQLPDFRAGERCFNLIEQVAGRAGRADLPGRVIVQSYDAQAIPIRAAASYDRELFLKHDLYKRKMLNYPPYVRLANALIWGKNEDEVKQAARELYERLDAWRTTQGCEGWSIYPPTSCVLSRLRGNYRYHLCIKAPAGEAIGPKLKDVIMSFKAPEGVKTTLDIDPVSLL